MVWMHYSIGRFLLCDEEKRGIKCKGCMPFFVNDFFGFVKKEAKTWQKCQFAGFYQRKYNGIKRFCGVKQRRGKKKKPKREKGITTHVLVNTDLVPILPLTVKSIRENLKECFNHSFPSGEWQSRAWCVESLCTCQPHCMLLWSMSQYVPEGNKNSLLGVILLMLVRTFSCY